MNTIKSIEGKAVTRIIDSDVKRPSTKQRILKSVRKNYQLYIFLLPAILYFLIFQYGPMYGIQIAFKDFMPSKGIWGSHWVGFKHFRNFFDSYYFPVLIKNTIGISLYSLIAGFPIPILLALMLNEVKNNHMNYSKKLLNV